VPWIGWVSTWYCGGPSLSLACSVMGVGVFSCTVSEALTGTGIGFGPVHVCSAVASSVLPFSVVVASMLSVRPGFATA